MENYLTIAQRWADLKREIIVEHERVAPMIVAITEEFKSLSGQAIPAEHIQTSCKIHFYPHWGGFCYTYDPKFSTGKPTTDRHWHWSLKESEQVLIFLKSLHEEEVKILFRQWAEKCGQ